LLPALLLSDGSFGVFLFVVFVFFFFSSSGAQPRFFPRLAAPFHLSSHAPSTVFLGPARLR